MDEKIYKLSKISMIAAVFLIQLTFQENKLFANELNKNDLNYIRSVSLHSLHEVCKSGDINICYDLLIKEYTAITSGYFNDWGAIWIKNKRCHEIKDAEELRQILFKYYPYQPGLYDSPAYVGMDSFIFDAMVCKRK